MLIEVPTPAIKRPGINLVDLDDMGPGERSSVRADDGQCAPVTYDPTNIIFTRPSSTIDVGTTREYCFSLSTGNIAFSFGGVNETCWTFTKLICGAGVSGVTYRRAISNADLTGLHSPYLNKLRVGIGRKVLQAATPVPTPVPSLNYTFSPNTAGNIFCCHPADVTSHACYLGLEVCYTPPPLNNQGTYSPGVLAATPVGAVDPMVVQLQTAVANLTAQLAVLNGKKEKRIMCAMVQITSRVGLFLKSNKFQFIDLLETENWELRQCRGPMQYPGSSERYNADHVNSGTASCTSAHTLTQTTNDVSILCNGITYILNGCNHDGSRWFCQFSGFYNGGPTTLKILLGSMTTA
jgi:hypothetical protein